MCFKQFIELGAAGLLALSSCTILEDRSTCPCTLLLDLSDPKNGVCDTLMVNVWSPDGFSTAYFVTRDHYGEPQTVTVPSRHGANICVIDASVAPRYVSGPGGGIFIPVGEQCPLAYMYSSKCVTSSEICVDTVTVSKNYCGITLNFISEDLDFYDVTVKGNVNGYSSSGVPVEGDFEFSPTGGKVCYFRIPRQLDGSLELSLTIPDGREKIFAMGQYILQSGYDWTEKDLQDLAVTINYAATSLTITIEGWSSTVEYDVVI